MSIATNVYAIPHVYLVGENIDLVRAPLVLEDRGSVTSYREVLLTFTTVVLAMLSMVFGFLFGRADR